MITKPFTIHHKISQLSLEQQQAFLKNDLANFFQTIETLHFFNTIGLETFTFAVECNEKITAFVSGVIYKESGVKSLFTSRAIIYGGPVFSEEVEEEHIIELFKTVLRNIKNKVVYIEIRNFNDYSKYATIFDEIGFEYLPHLNFQLECSTEENTRKKLSSSKLRQIKKSIKEGAEIREAKHESEIEDYYILLVDLYKSKIKTPLPKLNFFTTLWSQGIAKFLLIFYKEEVIGGIVCPIFQDKVIYEWYICGKDAVYKNVYPSVLATWAAILYACKNDIKLFDFMGAGKPDEDYGVREFKSKFGGDLVEHGRFIYVTNPILYGFGKRAVKVLKSL
ncbi:lipid II:glycine glycyltransferase FemX [Aquimarina longa]|uniref:lipid II:glycine glycyltransferase FemX n=1 Tax=Aquimarina longa TaxID=1080221 RepID=UPI000785E159|nr:peptidoglycan bridge formation glycyltransferase FemA/FemB family protein [Aquimarina longa]